MASSKTRGRPPSDLMTSDKYALASRSKLNRVPLLTGVLGIVSFCTEEIVNFANNGVSRSCLAQNEQSLIK